MSEEDSQSLHAQIGQRIRIGREQAGLTQPQLAEHVGRERKTIGFWEKGDVAGIPAVAIRTMAALFGRSVSWLLCEPEPEAGMVLLDQELVEKLLAVESVEHVIEIVGEREVRYADLVEHDPTVRFDYKVPAGYRLVCEEEFVKIEEEVSKHLSRFDDEIMKHHKRWLRTGHR